MYVRDSSCVKCKSICLNRVQENKQDRNAHTQRFRMIYQLDAANIMQCFFVFITISCYVCLMSESNDAISEQYQIRNNRFKLAYLKVISNIVKGMFSVADYTHLAHQNAGFVRYLLSNSACVLCSICVCTLKYRNHHQVMCIN